MRIHKIRRTRAYHHDSYCMCQQCYKRKFKSKQMDYFAYVKSPQWIARKQAYYATHKKQCQACGSIVNIELHHMQYGFFGHEPDYILIPMCQACHTDFHKQYRMQNNMIKDTLFYCEQKQKKLKELLDS